MAFSFLTQELAMDLGTANTVIFQNDQIVLDEPSIVAIDNSTGKEIYSPENLIQLQTIRYHIESGRTYRIECSSGSNPYKLILKL